MSEPTRLCVVAPYAPNSMGFGGMGRSAKAYLIAFRRLGIGIDYVSSTGSMVGEATSDDLERSFPGIKAYYFRPSFSKRYGVGIGFFLLLPIIIRARAVVLHGARTSMPTLLTAMLCRALGKRYAIIAHGQLEATRVAQTRAKRRLLSLTEGAAIWSIRGAKVVILSGLVEQRTLLPELANLPIRLIENFFEFDVDQSKPSSLEHPKTYLFVGRAEPDKGVLAFTRIWRAVASATSRLQIVGDADGPYAALVRAEAAADARISYLGEVPRERVYDLMQHCSVVVLPTGMDDPVTENFGNVIVEGFIAGRPGMVTTGLHWDSYATEPAVIRFEPTSEGAAECIRAFEQIDASAYMSMSKSAIKLASLFHIDRALPKVRAILEELS